jgi:hypothetical protein
MSAWQTIVLNFRELFEKINSNLTVECTEALGVAKLDVRSAAPESIWDRAFVIAMNGMPKPTEYVVGIIDWNYSTRLQIAFNLNQNDDQTTYLNAVSDIETIIKERINPTSFETDNALVNVQHTGTSGFNFVGAASNQTFAYVNIDFLIAVREVL